MSDAQQGAPDPLGRHLERMGIQPGSGVFRLRSGTRVDTGLWFRRARLWVVVAERELVLFAEGPRPYTQQIRCADVRESIYNPVTGEVDLFPPPVGPVRAFACNPRDGARFLDALRS